MDEIKTSAPPEAKLHFLDYWRVIRIRKAIIITVFLITAIIATGGDLHPARILFQHGAHQGGKRRDRMFPAWTAGRRQFSRL